MKREFGKFTYMVAAAASVAVTALSFLSDKRMFTFPDRSDDRYMLAVTDYGICKILMFILVFAAFYGLFTLLFSKDELYERLLGIVKCAALYLPVMAVILVIKIPQGFLTNDEYSICANALGLIHDTWFGYMTIYYYIVSVE